MIPDEQRAVFEFLSRPEAYGLGAGAGVERIDTHISAVFLAGNRVFKLKRAVRLPFVDFTDAEARRQACLAEVALNRRTAPGLYLGLATVTREADGRLALSGAGQVVEWLVAMKRFDQSALFDRMLARGALNRDHFLDLAEAIAAFHARAEPRRDQGGAAGMQWTLDNAAICMDAAVPEVFDADSVAAFDTAARREFAAVRDLLERRRAAGFVRRCHGDLHLRNICLFEGRPTPFDAIEFSEAIACIDVWYDLAFLLMDLDQAGQRGWASLVFNHYQQVTGDLGALPALPLFLACRAAIRAYVAAQMAAGEAGEARAARHREARAYLDRALAYLRPPPPRLVAVGGLSGSGKSRMAREIAPHLGDGPGAVVVRSDVLRKRLAGSDLGRRLEADGYSAEMTERTYQALYDETLEVLRAGHCAIADAVFARPEQRAAIEAVARRAGVPFVGLWLEAPPEVMLERVEKRRRNVSDATAAVVRQQLDYDLGPMAWGRFDTSGPRHQTLAAVLKAVGVTN